MVGPLIAREREREYGIGWEREYIISVINHHKLPKQNGEQGASANLVWGSPKKLKAEN